MSIASETLIKLLKLNEGKANFKRNFNFKLYPFYTRNPERAKFGNGFTPVLGAISRHSLGLKAEYTQSDYKIDAIYENVDSIDNLDEHQKQAFLERIFGFNRIDSIKHPFVINYYPLSEGKDRRGEMDIGLYMSKIFNLRSNTHWRSFVGNKISHNLVEKILLESIDNIPEKDEPNTFVTIVNDLFESKEQDLEFLLNHKDFALKNLDKFFAFYYFQYILQTVLNLDHIKSLKNGAQLHPLYFTLDSEKLTNTRATASNGYNLIKDIHKNTLVNENLLGYINILLNALYNDEKFYSFTDIFNFSFYQQQQLNNELVEVLQLYGNVFGKYDQISNDLESNILLFKKWLMQDLAQETISRYYLSIEEIGNLFFLKNRGSMGKTLTLRKDMLILLTALIVKDKKMLIKDVFVEFENRGVFLDRYTKEEILNFYEKMNILDKKSDSGDVKYVKPVL